MGPILTCITLWVVTVSSQTQDHLLETLYEKAVSPTTDQHNENFQNARTLADDEIASNNLCTKSIQSNKGTSKKLPSDESNAKHQLIDAAAQKLNPKIPAQNFRRADKPNTDDVNDMYYDTDLVGLDSIVEPPIVTEFPSFREELLHKAGEYPQAEDYYVVAATTKPPLTTTTLSANELVSLLRKNYETIPSPLDKDEMEREISSDYQLNFVPSVNENTTRAQGNMDCGNKKHIKNTKSSDEIVHYRRNNSEETDDPVIDVKTNTEKGKDVVESRLGGQEARGVKKNGRVCYACSTASNPNCLVPNNRTTIKYCQKDRDSCVTKTFEVSDPKDTAVLTRDCGSSCSVTALIGISPKISKCSVCHEDLCNGAFSLNKQNFFFNCSVILVAVIKSWV